jgi:glutamate synthase (ferredoxin)
VRRRRRQPAGTRPESCRVIRIKSPILTNEELEKIRDLDGTGPGGFKSITLPITFNLRQGVRGLELALTFLCQQADEATKDANGILIPSDRGVNRENAAIPGCRRLGRASSSDQERQTDTGRAGARKREPRVHHFRA